MATGTLAEYLASHDAPTPRDTLAACLLANGIAEDAALDLASGLGDALEAAGFTVVLAPEWKALQREREGR